jgi:peptidoglycan/LPS O-acetylase OafA/YrhL
MQNKIEEKSFHSLEGMRFIASMGIVFSHFFLYLDQYPQQYSFIVHKFYLFVDLFFVISGFVITYVYGGKLSGAADYAEYMKRRFARLYPLHLITLLFYVAIAVAMTYGLVKPDNPAKYDFQALIPNLLLIHGWGVVDHLTFNYPSWSISAEFFAYLAFPLVFWLIKRQSFWTGLLLCSLILATAFFIAERLIGAPLTTLNHNFSPLRAMASFAIGVWLQIHLVTLSQKISAPFAQAGLWITSILTMLGMMLHAPDPLIVLVCYGVVSFAAIADQKGLATYASWKPISRLGDLTYSTYMLHSLVATVFMSVIFPKVLGTSLLATSFSIVLALAITIFISIISLRFFETPARRWINRWPLPFKKDLAVKRG